MKEEREKIRFSAVLFTQNKKSPGLGKQQCKYVVVHIVYLYDYTVYDVWMRGHHARPGLGVKWAWSIMIYVFL